MNPMVLYFITNLPVPIFTSQNMNLIRPATPEIKYVHKFNWIDGHGVGRPNMLKSISVILNLTLGIPRHHLEAILKN